MSENDTKRNQKQAASTDTAPGQDVGQKEVQDAFDVANEQGFFGVTTDPTPDENYTLQGVSQGLPTPETDQDQATAVLDHQRKLGRGDVDNG